jgi:hypothetical protein
MTRERALHFEAFLGGGTAAAKTTYHKIASDADAEAEIK